MKRLAFTWLAVLALVACRDAAPRAAEPGPAPASVPAAPGASSVAPESAARAGPEAAAPSASSGPLAPPTLTISEVERARDYETGLWLRVFQLDESPSEIVELVPGQTPNVSRVVTDLALGETRRDFGLESNYVSWLDGALFAPENGTYALRITSDDGSRLWIDGRVVVDNDGLHGPRAQEGTLALARGWHRIAVRHFEAGGGAELLLEWRTPSAAEFVVIPPDCVATQSGLVRETADGVKRAVRALARGAPGDGRELEGLHPAYSLQSLGSGAGGARGGESPIGGIDFLPDGRLVWCTADEVGAVFTLALADEHGASPRRIAAGLDRPLGLCVQDGRIFVLQASELTELVDHDGDGFVDEQRAIASGWSHDGECVAMGLAARGGKFHVGLPGLPARPGAPRGGVLAIDPARGEFVLAASGLRFPQALGTSASGELFVSECSDPTSAASKLCALAPGASTEVFFGASDASKAADARAVGRAATPPVLWIPHDELGESPGQAVVLGASHGPYAGELVFGDAARGGLARAALETVDGVLQGSALRFSAGLHAGTLRLAQGPDGSLVVGGVGPLAPWSAAGRPARGIERLVRDGEVPFELLAVHARENGFELEFTAPLESGLGADPRDYAAEQWWCPPDAPPGGGKRDLRALEVRSASVSADRRRVFLEIAGVEEGHVVHLRVVGPCFDERGRPPWTTEAWYTLNRLPLGLRGEVQPPATESARPLEPGWRALFDGRSLAGWRRWRGDGVPSGWRAVDGVLERVADAPEAGDLRTLEEFGDFELELEWQIAAGGNSGIFFRAVETPGESSAPYESAPEMQILDNLGHPDGKNPRTSAGANYALDAPPYDATFAPGRWNRARLVVRGAHVEHWLNGRLQCAYELWTDEWKAKVAASKFAQWPGYGLARSGAIVLQDHGDPVRFRSVRIRTGP